MTEDVLGRDYGLKGCLFLAPISHRYLGKQKGVMGRAMIQR